MSLATTDRLTRFTDGLVQRMNALERQLRHPTPRVRSRGMAWYLHRTGDQISRAQRYFPADDALTERILRLQKQRQRALRQQTVRLRQELEQIERQASWQVPAWNRTMTGLWSFLGRFWGPTKTWLTHPLIDTRRPSDLAAPRDDAKAA